MPAGLLHEHELEVPPRQPLRPHEKELDSLPLQTAVWEVEPEALITTQHEIQRCPALAVLPPTPLTVIKIRNKV